MGSRLMKLKNLGMMMRVRTITTETAESVRPTIKTPEESSTKPEESSTKTETGEYIQFMPMEDYNLAMKDAKRIFDEELEELKKECPEFFIDNDKERNPRYRRHILR